MIVNALCPFVCAAASHFTTLSTVAQDKARCFEKGRHIVGASPETQASRLVTRGMGDACRGRGKLRISILINAVIKFTDSCLLNEIVMREFQFF